MKTEKNMEQINLFVYGTLQNGQNRNVILQGFNFEKAILFHFKKVTPPNLGFPFIIHDVSTELRGEVYFNLNVNLLSQIDLIEGEGSLYHRIIVKVKVINGKFVKAFTYYPDEKLINKYM